MRNRAPTHELFVPGAGGKAVYGGGQHDSGPNPGSLGFEQVPDSTWDPVLTLVKLIDVIKEAG